MAVAAWVIGQGQTGTPTTETYKDDQLGLSFAHPTSWILEKSNAPAPKKGKKRSKKVADTGVVHFRIPLVGAPQDADLEIMRASFTGPPDTWQTVQVQANKDLHRTVDRQWQQEILGVPMLLTRISYTDQNTNLTALTGLLYTDSPSKLLFRLSAPSSDFDKVQFDYDQAMQTLRTTNNQLPKAEDPDHPPVDPAKIDPRGQKHVLIDAARPITLKWAPESVPLTVAAKKVVIRVPQGWTAEHVDGATCQLRSPALSYPISLRCAAAADADPPETALLTASAASLADFTTVTRRVDSSVVVNPAGCTVENVWRSGVGPKGPLDTVDAIGIEGEYYFVASCRPVPGPTLAAQRKVIDALLQAIGIQPAP